MQLGLTVPDQVGGPLVPPASPSPAPLIPTVSNIGGFLPMQSVAQMQQQEKKDADLRFQQEQSQPAIVGLAGHIRGFFERAKAERQTVTDAMIEAIYARRGEYTPTKRAELIKQNSSLIYMMLFSVKCRQAESLLRDVLSGSGVEKPWTVRPTPKPDLPPMEVQSIMQTVAEEVYQAQMMGLAVSTYDIRQRLMDARSQLEARLMEEARHRCERMEVKMEDQLNEGGFRLALDQFISDLTTFKTAILKGPVVRRKPTLKWADGELQVVRDLKLEWERVDPMRLYPAGWAKDLQSAPFVEYHEMSRSDLNDLIGVQGYSDTAIRRVLTEYDTGQTSMWIPAEVQKKAAEGRDQLGATTNTGLISALQYWGSVSGKMLREWGMKPEEVPDESKEYEVEAWLVGTTVIRAVLNQDPLGRRPYYTDSYERVPGAFWGNSMYDLMRDCQDMCNAAARSLVNNMAISSGPQVVVFGDRLPPGSDVTAMFPWKIWQAVSDPMGSTARPIDFFQPGSNANELMAVYEKFAALADEYTGIPRYMTGVEGTPGAGRTASGLSMMIGNASKVIKQVVNSIDTYIIQPMLERLYQHNMLFGDDDSMKGDVNVVARGAMSLVTKENAQVRRNEFLQLTANPIDMQIVGLDGRAALLREAARNLDMDTDKIVPPLSVIKQRAAMAQMAAMQQAQPQQQGKKPGSGQELVNGAPVTDNFQPS